MSARGANAVLALLAARRALPLPAVLVALTALLLLLAPAPELALAGPAADDAVLRAARLETAWSVLLVAALAPLVHAAAAVGDRWRQSERLWLGARSVSRAAVCASGWAGVLAAGGATLALVAVAAELAAGPPAGPDGEGSERGRPRRLVARLDSPRAILVEAGERVAWEVDGGRALGATGGRGASGSDGGAAGPRRSVSLELATAPGSGPSARVRLTARRGGAERAAEAVVFGRSRIEVAVPQAAPGRREPSVALELEKLGEGCAVVVPPRAAALLAPAASPRSGSVALLVRAALLFGSLAAVATAAGAWMRASTATALALALALPALGAGAPWVPGADLAGALGLVGDGLAPPAPPGGLVPALAGLAVLGAAGAAAGARGLRRDPEGER